MVDTALRSMSRWLAHEEHDLQPGRSSHLKHKNHISVRLIAWLCTLFIALIAVMYTLVLIATVGLVGGAGLGGKRFSGSTSSSVPGYFQTTTELYAGPTQTAIIEVCIYFTIGYNNCTESHSAISCSEQSSGIWQSDWLRAKYPPSDELAYCQRSQWNKHIPVDWPS